MFVSDSVAASKLDWKMSFKRAHHNKILPGTTKCQTTRRGFKPPVIIHPMEGHIPKEFGRIKLDNENFMGNPKLNFFYKFKSPPSESRQEIRTEAVPKKRTFFSGKPYTTNMGCIRSKEKEFDLCKKEHVEVKEPEKEKNDASEKTSDESGFHKILQQMREDCKKAHNVYRAKHKVAALKLNDELNKLAQKWAEHLASIRTLKHSDCKWKDDIVGENIAYKWMSNGGEFTGQEVTDNWYNEVEKYDYDVGRSQGTGHFTQVVWKGSLEFGMGMARASDGSFYVVCNYFPAGNIIGKFEENVLKPK